MIVGELLATHEMESVLCFRRDKNDALHQTVYDSKWHGQLRGWLASLTLEDEVRQDLSLRVQECFSG